MRRVMVLALLALTLPTAALASSVTFRTGNVPFLHGSFFVGPLRCCVSAGEGGPTLTIGLIGAPFTGAIHAGGELLGGFIRVLNPFTGAIFQDDHITRDWKVSIGSAIVEGSLERGGGSLISVGSSTANPFSSATVSGTTAPEPSAFEGLLLGAGVIGLAEMTRRKLRLGT